ncbi:MAG: hypothetical protein HY047_03280 [Acidobacteria bacterium]|nr:hypothetical protein [Acidobacteriota bacterium]
MNVERLMEQIRTRIREKRGVDYTEQQIQELANVKLEKILDPRGIRSDLLEQFQKMQPANQPAEVTEQAMRTSKLFDSHRPSVRFIRRLLRPILKLFFNPAPVVQVLQGGARDPLFFELIHNLVVETTRLGIEVKNLKMRVESLTGRLEFNERRARALESVVVYKPADEPVVPPPARPAPARTDHRPPTPTFDSGAAGQPTTSGAAPAVNAGQRSATGGDRPPQAGGAPFVQGEGPGQRSRRRRRRRGRRSGGGGIPSGQPSPTLRSSENTTTADRAAATDAQPRESHGDRAPEPRPQGPATDSGPSGHEPDSQ